MRLTAFVAVSCALCLVVGVASPDARGSSDQVSTILNFSPTSFPVKAEAGFFYSIDKDLRYSDRIDPSAPALAHGTISGHQVSPDGTKLAAVLNGRLTLIDTAGVIADVVKADDFGVGDLQWSRDSKAVYFHKGHYKDRKTNPGELWKYSIDLRRSQLIVKPFNVSSYFQGPNEVIYFSEFNDRGYTQPKMFDGRTTTIVSDADLRRIDRPFSTLPSLIESVPFNWRQETLAWSGVGLDHTNGLENLVLNGRTYMSVTEGKGFDGYYYCSRYLNVVFLPGNKYFVIDLPDCSNFKGQLLFEVASGHYQVLPRKTVVYQTLNTDNFEHFRVTKEGITLDRKVQPAPEWKLKQAALNPVEMATPFVVREVRGTISSTAGQPLAYSEFLICRNDQALNSTRTGDGAFRVDPIELFSPRAGQPRPGTYRFKAVRAGYHPAVGTLVISPDAPKTSSLDIRLEFAFDVEADWYHLAEIGKSCR